MELFADYNQKTMWVELRLPDDEGAEAEQKMLNEANDENVQD
jgi:hypothetical protein